MKPFLPNMAKAALAVVVTFGVVLGALMHGVQAGTLGEKKANLIVEKADRIRFPKSGFQVEVRITTTGPDQEPDIREYRVLQKGNDKSVVQTTAPASERGQIMLLRGSDLWVFLPAVSQPVRLPLAQRLTGQVANGDLARANFAGDYNAEILRQEEIEGSAYHVIELTAARSGVTYHRVLYWVNKNNYRPYKAQFFTVSNRLMKEAFYEDYKEMQGKVRPARLVMEDRLRKGERSVMVYAGLKPRKLPDKLFTKNYLKKLQ